MSFIAHVDGGSRPKYVSLNRRKLYFDVSHGQTNAIHNTKYMEHIAK